MATDKLASRTELSGVWKRVLLVDEVGVEDRQSEVYWVQSRKLCGDIRLHLLHSTLADLKSTGDASRVEAFAGHLLGSEGDFRWQPSLRSWRDIGPPDEGRLSWIGDDLHEDGIHRAYTERWERIAVPTDDDFAVELHHPTDNALSVLLRVGTFVFYARGVPTESAGGSEAEFSLFEMQPDGMRLVLSTVDSESATRPVIEVPDNEAGAASVRSLPHRDGSAAHRRQSQG
jgi:hypothetical protein